MERFCHIVTRYMEHKLNKSILLLKEYLLVEIMIYIFNWMLSFIIVMYEKMKKNEHRNF